MSSPRRDNPPDVVLRWASCVRPKVMAGTNPAMTINSNSVMILETLGEVVDVLRRPARHFHAQMQAHLRQNLLDLVERLAAEVRGAEHFRLGLLH